MPIVAIDCADRAGAAGSSGGSGSRFGWVARDALSGSLAACRSDGWVRRRTMHGTCRRCQPLRRSYGSRASTSTGFRAKRSKSPASTPQRPARSENGERARIAASSAAPRAAPNFVDRTRPNVFDPVAVRLRRPRRVSSAVHTPPGRVFAGTRLAELSTGRPRVAGDEREPLNVVSPSLRVEASALREG